MKKHNLVTKNEIRYDVVPYGHIATIPAGTPVIPASNLPDNNQPRYWAEPWAGIPETEESWCRNYGFLLQADEVINL